MSPDGATLAFEIDHRLHIFDARAGRARRPAIDRRLGAFCRFSELEHTPAALHRQLAILIDDDRRVRIGACPAGSTESESTSWAELARSPNGRWLVEVSEPTEEQLKQMRRLVAENMRLGALGLSTGLFYPPGSYAQTAEVIELCREVARLDGVYATHMRDEADRLLESIEETQEIARSSGVSTQISHLKVAYPRNWSKIDQALQAIEEADRAGLAVLERVVDRFLEDQEKVLPVFHV